jgi:hypothetical protein
MAIVGGELVRRRLDFSGVIAECLDRIGALN